MNTNRRGGGRHTYYGRNNQRAGRMISKVLRVNGHTWKSLGEELKKAYERIDRENNRKNNEKSESPV